jgi:hypothetical protein
VIKSSQHFFLHDSRDAQRLGEGLIYEDGSISVVPSRHSRVEYFPDIAALYRAYPQGAVEVPAELQDEESDAELLSIVSREVVA